MSSYLVHSHTMMSSYIFATLVLCHHLSSGHRANDPRIKLTRHPAAAPPRLGNECAEMPSAGSVPQFYNHNHCPRLISFSQHSSQPPRPNKAKSSASFPALSWTQKSRLAPNTTKETPRHHLGDLRKRTLNQGLVES